MKNNFGAITKIYPLVYLTEDDYAPWESHLQKLANHMKTRITYDFGHQRFNIEGHSQSTCEIVAAKIMKLLLPRFNEQMDEDKFYGTYPSIDYKLPVTLINTDIIPQSPDYASPNDTQSPRIRITGRPLPLSGNEGRRNDSNAGTPTAGSPTAVTRTVETPNSTVSPGHSEADFYQGETESEGESEPETHEFSGKFTFAKNIKQPNDILIGPPMSNRQQTNYLKMIEQETQTECALLPNSNDVSVSGSTQEQVDDAISRLRLLQTLYKRRGKKPTSVPCIHPNPKDPRPFKLYFADLEMYRHKDLVFVPPVHNRPLYVLLPVRDDPRTGKPAKPADLIDIRSLRSSPSAGSISRNTAVPTASTLKTNYRQPSSGYSPADPVSPELPAATWGGNAIRQVGSTVLTQDAEHWKNRQHIVRPQPSPAQQETEFPSLPTKPAKKPSVQPPGKKMQRRVLHITSQKADNGNGTSTSSSVLDDCRNYNFHNARAAFTEGLEHARGIAGDIKLGAKLGKVLWNNIAPDLKDKIWEFQDIKDIAMRELNIRPVFNNVTTVQEEVMDSISRQFPEYYSKTACFEIHAQARNQPNLDYQPIIMIMNPGAMDFQKVIVQRDRISEVNWVSLDRKFDFQMYLNAEELTRTDVKPYSTFLKKLSIDMTTLKMTYENIPDFLKVTHIFYKQTTKSRLHFPFVAEMTTVERVPLRPQQSMGFGVDKILADTGSGDVWYDCEVFYTAHNEFFKRNLDLSVGKLASWTVNDILGENVRTLFDYIQCMVMITELWEEQVRT